MRIHHATPRGKIQQLQAHRQHDPRDNQPGPRRPPPLHLPEPIDAERTPQHVLDDADDHISCHIVRVIKPPERQVRDVRQISQNTERRPHADDAGLLGPVVPVEAEDADRREVEAVQHAGAGGEVVELLGQARVARVEEHAEQPAREAAVAEGEVVFAERVLGRDVRAQLLDAVVVGEVVEEGEDDGEGLLHA